MSNNDWVQEGTPRDAEWNAEADDYGVPLEQWDDYSAEQAVPVPTPSQNDSVPQETAPDPADVADEAGAPVDEVGTDHLDEGVEPTQATDTAIPEPEFNPDEVRSEEAVTLQPADVYPGVADSAEARTGDGEGITFTDATGPDEPAEGDGPDLNQGSDSEPTGEYADQPNDEYVAQEGDADEVGPDVFHDPVIADDLVAEGDPRAVTSPEAADELIDDTVHRPVPAVDENVEGDEGYVADETADQGYVADASVDEGYVADDHADQPVVAEETFGDPDATDESYDDPSPATVADLDGPAADDPYTAPELKGDAGTIPAPVLTDEDGDPAVDADEAADNERAWNDDPALEETNVTDRVDGDDTPYEPHVESSTLAEPLYDPDTDARLNEANAADDEVDPDATQLYTNDDPQAGAFGRPAGEAEGFSAAAPVAAAGGAAAMAGLYRGENSDDTQVLDATTERRTIEQEREEEDRIARELQAEREARASRLGMVATSDANATRDTRVIRRGVGGFGSFGLFVLRLVTALILGVVGYQVLTNISETAEYLSRQPMIPEPRLVTWIIGFTLAAMALMLVIGLGVRVVGFVLAALAIASLALLRWGSFDLFVDGMEGFRGDLDLLLAAVGILFFSLGGGRFGIDGAFSKARETAREAKRS